ncbi:MAG: phosphoadenosine phosphosulfate reductase, partial [Bacteroidales bacterium]|nr:phosphoadenosine phosphosulfate reductase [Bacteroidales bacterium]
MEILNKVLHNENITSLLKAFEENSDPSILNKAKETILQPTSSKFLFSQKLSILLDLNIPTFNSAVFHTLHDSTYPIAQLAEFPLVSNSDIIIKEDVINFFNEYGITYPKYYQEIDYEVNGETGKYAR